MIVTEIERIVEQMRRAFEGPAWHGPAVMELLNDVTAEEAMARPLLGRHTIWELALHIKAWIDVTRRRIQGETITSLPYEEDWPPIPEPSVLAWRETIERLRESNGLLLKSLSEFSDARLEETVPGSSYSFYTMFHGIIQHNLYHAGQMAILRRIRR